MSPEAKEKRLEKLNMCHKVDRGLSHTWNVQWQCLSSCLDNLQKRGGCFGTRQDSKNLLGYELRVSKGLSICSTY